MKNEWIQCYSLKYNWAIDCAELRKTQNSNTSNKWKVRKVKIKIKLGDCWRCWGWGWFDSKFTAEKSIYSKAMKTSWATHFCVLSHSGTKLLLILPKCRQIFISFYFRWHHWEFNIMPWQGDLHLVTRKTVLQRSKRAHFQEKHEKFIFVT